MRKADYEVRLHADIEQGGWRSNAVDREKAGMDGREWRIRELLSDSHDLPDLVRHGAGTPALSPDSSHSVSSIGRGAGGIGKAEFYRDRFGGRAGMRARRLSMFEAGRLRGKRVLRLLCALASDPSYCIRNSKATFAKKGVRALVIAKFIPGLDAICPPLAGMSGASRADFLLYDAVGSALWSAAYVTCGFVFARELDKVVRYTSVFANVLILALGVPMLVFFLWKVSRLVRMIRLLRPLQITPEQLKVWMDSGERIGIVDLLRFEDDPQGTALIPGAVRLDPLQIRRKKRIFMPENVDLVLYCGSKNSFVSARVAAAMRKHGIHRIHVLKGGFGRLASTSIPAEH